jgi:hypothetical protein
MSALYVRYAQMSLPVGPNPGGGEGEHAGDRERHAAEEDEWAELAPARLGPVGGHADDRVVDPVPDATHQQHGRQRAGADAKHVGVEERQIPHESLPVEHRGEIAAAIGELFAHRESVGGGGHIGKGSQGRWYTSIRATPRSLPAPVTTAV